ncbi:MAG: YdcF family protein [Gemmatimonadota bacterium]|mgnify:CR=1 FL=1
MRRPLVVALLVLATAWLLSLVAVFVASRRDAAAPADAIVVLGAAQYNGRPSPVLKARLDHAVELYRRGLAPFIIVTGGIGAGDTLSEAAVAERYLWGLGIPEPAILKDATGHSSLASLRAAARKVRARSGRRAILVSDGFHMLRLTIIGKRLQLEPLASPAPQSPISASFRRELWYLLAESIKAPIAFLVTRS